MAGAADDHAEPVHVTAAAVAALAWSELSVIAEIRG